MAFPHVIAIGPYCIRVLTDADAINSGESFAEFSPTRMTIKLAPEFSPEKQRVSLAHEVLHAIFHTSGREDSEKLTDEQIACTYAPLLVDTLRRNPELVAALLEGAA